MFRTSLNLGLALLALSLGGCIITVEDANDVSLNGSWTVNGLQANLGVCESAGIDRVRLTVFEPDTDVVVDDFIMPCEDGSFDTRPDKVLDYGDYDTLWDAIDIDGNVVATGPLLQLDVTLVEHATLATVDFSIGPFGNDVSLDGAWTINGLAANAGVCASAGIDTVELTIISSGVDYTDDSLRFDCGAGAFDSRPNAVLKAGSYQTQWTAYDVDGAVVDEGPALDLDVTAVSHATLATVNFEVVLATTGDLQVNTFWEVGGSYSDCAAAQVTSVAYTLTDAGGATVFDETGLACTPSLSFTDLDPGTYDIEIYGTGDKDSWAIVCQGLTVEVGQSLAYDCDVDLSNI